jgi:hypothetical protein
VVEGAAAFDISLMEQCDRVKSLQEMPVKRFMDGGMPTVQEWVFLRCAGRDLSIGLWSGARLGWIPQVEGRKGSQ